MVKRAPTPPPPDDEPRHLTVVGPYPPYANMGKREELIAFIRWLACAMNGCHHHLYAVFHRPSAANMLVIEVSREFPHFRGLLGAHKWSDFVLNPGPHRDKISRIYYSTYPNARAVEKAGWKRIFVEDTWFEGWHPRNKYIAYPYPMSSYCDVPHEIPTSVENCRPLPVDLFNTMRVSTAPLVQVPGSWPKKFILPSHSHLQPIIADDKTLSETNTNITGSSSISISDVSSNAESAAVSTKDTHVSGTAITVNGATLTWDFEGDDKEENSDVKNDDTKVDEEDEIDEYIASGYYKTDLEENREPVTNSHLDSIHPLLVNKHKPTCPSCGVLCKTTICRDYSSFIRRLEKKDADEKRRQRMQNGRGRANGRGRGQARGGFGYRAEAITTYSSGNKIFRMNSEEHGDRNGKVENEFYTPSNNKIYEQDIEGSNDKMQSADAVSTATTPSPSTTAKALTPNPESQSVTKKTSVLVLSASKVVSASSPLNKIRPLPPIAWAKGNPLTSKQNLLCVENGKKDVSSVHNGYFPALGTGSANGKVVHAPTTRPTSSPAIFIKPQAVTSEITPSASNSDLGGTRRPSVPSWAEVAHSRAKPASKPTVNCTVGTVIPPPIGKVLTASVIPSEGPLTVSWEEILRKDMEMNDFEDSEF